MKELIQEKNEMMGTFLLVKGEITSVKQNLVGNDLESPVHEIVSVAMRGQILEKLEMMVVELQEMGEAVLAKLSLAMSALELLVVEI